MKRICAIAVVAAGLVWSCSASAEILAMLNYESKTPDALKAFKTPVPGQTRTEGIAVIDVDPASPTYSKIVETIPLPPDLVAITFSTIATPPRLMSQRLAKVSCV